MVVTHEHKDHVYGFEVCKAIFTENFEIDRVWMGWTENEKSRTVKKWQKDYGDKKKALALASQSLTKIADDAKTKAFLATEHNGHTILEARKAFADSISELNTFHLENQDLTHW